jgi:hypothetical protein
MKEDCNMSAEVPYVPSGLREVGDFVVKPVGHTGLAVYAYKKAATSPLSVPSFKVALHNALWKRQFLLHKDSLPESENGPMTFYMNHLEKIDVDVFPDKVAVSSPNFDVYDAKKVNMYRQFLYTLETVLTEDIPKSS